MSSFEMAACGACAVVIGLLSTMYRVLCRDGDESKTSVQVLVTFLALFISLGAHIVMIRTCRFIIDEYGAQWLGDTWPILPSIFLVWVLLHAVRFYRRVNHCLAHEEMGIHVSDIEDEDKTG